MVMSLWWNDVQGGEVNEFVVCFCVEQIFV
jgi:hypothetical protein